MDNLPDKKNNVVGVEFGKRIDYKKSLCYNCKQPVISAPKKGDLAYDKKQDKYVRFKGVKGFFNPDFFMVCSPCYYKDKEDDNLIRDYGTTAKNEVRKGKSGKIIQPKYQTKEAQKEEKKKIWIVIVGVLSIVLTVVVCYLMGRKIA